VTGEAGAGARAAGGQELDLVFGALSDGNRRQMLDAIMREGSTSVPVLTAQLPITRQAVAKHLGVLGEAGLIQRRAGGGREVRYELAPGALQTASSWVQAADAAWAGRLDRLKRSLEGARAGS
jgi:DNA-binding transcriptional ArsR family regulator